MLMSKPTFQHIKKAILPGLSKKEITISVESYIIFLMKKKGPVKMTGVDGIMIMVH